MINQEKNGIESPFANPDVLGEDKKVWKERENIEILDKLHNFDYTLVCKDGIDYRVFIEHIQRGFTLKSVSKTLNISISILRYRKKKLLKRLKEEFK